ncbi:DUF7504 family protein [Halosolutus gelatinilyticus]|uniref:DUF7504 family protein n=1 Tax=Halosolutus gelatinilyticus TaxID=2931975 RepID=UPI001FF2C9B2|nr:hypothetical protein [Halosolutus gelatinilyticus]
MFSAKDRKQGSTDASFTDALSRLKQHGASVLVLGSVHPDQQWALSRRLLGHATDQLRRRVFVSTANGDALLHELSPAETIRVVRYESQTRCTVAEAPTTDGSATPSIDDQPTAETLGDLGIAISSAIEAFESESEFEPSELRVGVDSLLPLLEDYDTEQVFKFIHLTNGRVKAADGMIHYRLPIERDATVVPVLKPLFDVLVELREQNGIVQERWTLPRTDHSSGWISPPDS